MRSIRTDLAMEAHELVRENAPDTGAINGVEAREYTRGGLSVTLVRILDDNGREALGKPPGRYVTLEMPGPAGGAHIDFERVVRALADEVRDMLALRPSDTVMIAGLGNRSITADAVGPMALDSVMVTRHLVERVPEHFGHMREVCAMSPGVLGITGVETLEILRGVCARVSPKCLVVIDALASRRLSRLCTTIQLADTGIVPGSGVGNAREGINIDSIGVPVIAIGVPTVVEAGTLAADILEESGHTGADAALLSQFDGGLVVTPKEIDRLVADIARMIGYGLNLALHEGLDTQDVTAFLS